MNYLFNRETGGSLIAPVYDNFNYGLLAGKAQTILPLNFRRHNDTYVVVFDRAARRGGMSHLYQSDSSPHLPVISTPSSDKLYKVMQSVGLHGHRCKFVAIYRSQLGDNRVNGLT